MNKIIKITDIKSGKELEIVKGECENCFYNNTFNCPFIDEQCFLAENNVTFEEFIFQEVEPKKQEDENK
jgi:hypothetical protein